MDKTEKDFYLSLSQKYYALAFNLIPDELQASQLLVDALHRVGLEERQEDGNEINEARYVKAIFQLAKKRIHHQVAPKQTAAYFHLNLFERAVLYLSHKKRLEPSRISEYLGEKSSDVVGVLQGSREKLLKMNGMQFQL